MKIDITANILNDTGYASHVKQLASELSKEHDIRILTQTFPGWELKTKEKLIKLINKPKRKSDVHIMVGLPHFWEYILSTNPKNFIGFLVWECSKIPKFWLDICNDERVKQIWVPSNFTKKTLIDSGVNKDKLFVVHHGVDLEVFKPIKKKKEDKFKFLFSKGWVQGIDDRSGFDLLLTAFAKEFKKDEPVELLAKLNSSYISRTWNLQNEIEKVKDYYNIDLQECPPIKIVLENVPFKTLIKMYNNADVMVCPTKGEGFGLTMAESMACKTPVITSDFGGQTDFVNNENGWLLPTNLILSTDHNLLYEECYWGIIEIEKLRKIMRHVYENKKEVTEKGKKALSDIKKFTWKNSCKQANQALKKIKK
jgi:glycosyltransferase involved in cell wall biosynthesis